MRVDLRIAATWAGAPLPDAEVTRLTLSLAGDGPNGAMTIALDAPFHDDPPPAPEMHPRTARDGLWEFEVVELFLGGLTAGPAGPYTELEFGPHGHALGLRLAGYRNRIARFEVDFRSLVIDRVARRWQGLARVPLALLPPPPWCGNAFAMHGAPRHHQAAFPAPPGLAPDFHAAASWRPLSLG